MKTVNDEVILKAYNSTIDFCNSTLREIFLPFSETDDDLDSFIRSTINTVVDAPNDIKEASAVWMEYLKLQQMLLKKT